MTIGERIRTCRLNLGITLEELGTRTSVNKATIYKYEKGIITNIPSDKIEIISKALNVSPAFLMGWEDNSNNTKEFTPSHQQIEIVTIPLYDCIACGEMTFLEDDIIDYITLPSTMVSTSKDYFSNYAKGDSMIDRGINEGDLLVFEKTDYLENGDVGSFCYQNEATCKVYRETSNGIFLMPANNSYEPIYVDDEEFRIVGKLTYRICKEN